MTLLAHSLLCFSTIPILTIYIRDDILSFIRNPDKLRFLDTNISLIRQEYLETTIEWGLLYNCFKDTELDPDVLEREIKALLIDNEVTNKKGVYTYALTREEKYLSLRAFTTAQM